jgi:extracellular factor (EF) 3-hydroxypalmitic acid methyl ester biosynthesis protein
MSMNASAKMNYDIGEPIHSLRIAATQPPVREVDGMISDEFRKSFAELESEHIEIRKKLNALPHREGDLEERLYKEMQTFERWRFDLMGALWNMVADFDDEQKKTHQEYIRGTRYFKIIQEAPFYWRIINKPNGYAGDAYMMHYIYRNKFEGGTPFGKFLHKHACSTKACVAVRNRRQFLKDQILEKGGGKILSLAAGPAEEIREILEDGTLGKGYHFLALDHDIETVQRFNASNPHARFKYCLANAFQIIAGNYRIARPRNMMAKFCIPGSDFKGWRILMSALKYELTNLAYNEYDLVYSAGLFDYIKTFPLEDSKGSVALTKRLFELVKPGGSLIVGNFSYKNPPDLKFVMEYIYGWHLIYRGRDDMMRFARAIPENQIARMAVLEEESGINYFLKIDKAMGQVPPPRI